MAEEATGELAPISLAPLHMRLFALIVDYLLAVTLIKVFDQALMGADWDLKPEPTSDVAATVVWVVALFALMVLKDSLGGRSLGKWIAGMAIRQLDDLEQTPRLWHLWGRNLSLIVFPLDGALIFFDAFYRRAGERLFGTVVLVPATVSPLSRRLLILSAFFMAFLLASLVLTPWNMRRSSAYKTAMNVAERHPSVTKITGESPEFGGAPELRLKMEAHGGEAVVLLTTEGKDGDTRITVRLSMAQNPRRWKLVSLEVEPVAAGQNVQQAPAPER